MRIDWRRILLASLMVFALAGVLRAEMGPARRLEIIQPYLDILNRRVYTAAPLSDLPHPKRLVREAIQSELLASTTRYPVETLEGAYLELETFVSHAEFEIVKGYEDRLAERGGKLGKDPAGTAVSDTESGSPVPPEYTLVRRRILERQRVRMDDLKQVSVVRAPSKEIYHLDGVDCRFHIPRGFKKASAETQTLIEEMRMSCFPDEMPLEEKRLKAKLDAVFFQTLNRLELPLRPFFTVQVRDLGREMNTKDFERQVSLIEALAEKEKGDVRNREPITLRDHILSEVPMIDQENHVIVLSQRSGLFEGDPEAYLLIQCFNYYRTGYLTVSFYGDIPNMEKNLRDFETVMHSMAFGEEKRW